MFLFVSIPMMEKRSLEKRPDYQRIIDSTSMLIPWPPRRSGG
jgi:steroid 5-alpha reductase family enzyme